VKVVLETLLLKDIAVALPEQIGLVPVIVTTGVGFTVTTTKIIEPGQLLALGVTV
jgi:hypothetical protein